MNKRKIVAYGISFALFAAVFAVTGMTTAYAAEITSDASISETQASQETAQQSDVDILKRIDDLNKLNTTVQGMTNVSDAVKAQISAEITNNISDLTSLKVKIDADTDPTVLRADQRLIYDSFRIYMLIIPRGYAVASADRENKIEGLMTNVSSKLATDIQVAASQGKDVSAPQAELADLNAKIADAKSHSLSGALQDLGTLVPDLGNETLLASNTAIVSAARDDVMAARMDLEAARVDIEKIMLSLGLGIK